MYQKSLQSLGGQIWNKRQLGRPGAKWEYNTKINIKLMESENVESSALCNDRAVWWSVANTLIIHEVP